MKSYTQSVDELNSEIFRIRYRFFVHFCVAAMVASVVVSLILWYFQVALYAVIVMLVAGLYYFTVFVTQYKFEICRRYLNYLIFYGAFPFVFVSLASEPLSIMAKSFLYFLPFVAFFALGLKRGKYAMVIYVAAIIAVYTGTTFNPHPLYSWQEIVFSIAGVIFVALIGYFTSASREGDEQFYLKEARKYENYKLAVSQATNHIILTDINGKILFANEAAQRITGYTFAEMQGQTPRLWGGLQRSEFYQNMWKTIKADKKQFSGTIQNRKKNGELYTAIAHIAPILDDSQNLIGFMGAEEDVTKILDLESKLQEDRNRDEALLHSMGEGVIVQNKDGKISFVNKAATDLLLYSQEELIGNSFVSIVQAESSDGKPIPESERPLIKIAQTKTPITTELVYVRKDGTKFESNITIAPVFLGETYYGNIQVFKDITKEKEIDKAKTEFISLASHQLRTPLSTINWYCEMLLDGDAGPVNQEQKKFLEEAYGGSKRMSKLVNALLNVSRIETGTFMVEPENVDIVILARAVLDESKPKIDEKRLTVKLEKEEIPPIMLDPNLTTMILQNLITNSVKYTPEGGTITIVLRVVKKDSTISGQEIKSDGILIQVSDTGMGIPTSQKDQIFKKLFRADNVRKTETEGNGLGLYLIKSLIEHSHGRIWFESQENNGTTFYVLLPLSGMTKKEGEKRLER